MQEADFMQGFQSLGKLNESSIQVWGVGMIPTVFTQFKLERLGHVDSLFSHDKFVAGLTLNGRHYPWETIDVREFSQDLNFIVELFLVFPQICLED